MQFGLGASCGGCRMASPKPNLRFNILIQMFHALIHFRPFHTPRRITSTRAATTPNTIRRTIKSSSLPGHNTFPIILTGKLESLDFRFGRLPSTGLFQCRCVMCVGLRRARAVDSFFLKSYPIIAMRR